MSNLTRLKAALFPAAAIALALLACQPKSLAPAATPSSVATNPVQPSAGNRSGESTNGQKRPDVCNPAQPGTLQDITNTRASPYFVVHPARDNPKAPTVVFLGGGAGGRRSAERMWTNYLSRGTAREAFRFVLPYAVDMDFMDESPRTFGVLSEVLACYGGDPAQVHIGGVSNGGYAAFLLILAKPERFVSVLGAPGLFPITTKPEEWAKALGRRPVFNGVGANDLDWKPDVKAQHDALVAMRIDSVYVEFPGQGHTANQTFDNSVLFDFWVKHSR